MNELIDLYFELCFSIQLATGWDFWAIVWGIPAAAAAVVVVPTTTLLVLVTRFVAANHSAYTRW